MLHSSYAIRTISKNKLIKNPHLLCHSPLSYYELIAGLNIQ